MTTNHDSASSLTGLPEELAAHHAAFVSAFNSGDAKAIDQTYEPDGVLVPRPGSPMTGSDRLTAIRHLLAFGLPIEARPRHVYVADDIALLIVDWSIDGTTPEGTELHFEGTAADVARRGPDGSWRYVIDNPYGTA